MADLGGKIWKLPQSCGEFRGEPLGFAALAPERRHKDIAAAFERGIVGQKAKGMKLIQQVHVIGLGNTANLQVCAAGQIDQARAEALCRIAQAQHLIAAQAGKNGAHAHHQSVARHHRAKGAGAPSLCVGSAHVRRSRSARIELRRVVQRPAS